MSAGAALLPLTPMSNTLADKALANTVLRMLGKVRIFDQLRAAMRIAQPDSRAVRISANVTAHSGDRDRCAHRSGAGVDYSDRVVTISQIGFGLSHRFSS